MILEYTRFSTSFSFNTPERLYSVISKKIEIIDYKTGHIYEEEQIDTYIDILQSLPLVQGGGYRVSGRFLEIQVGGEP